MLIYFQVLICSNHEEPFCLFNFILFKMSLKIFQLDVGCHTERCVHLFKKFFYNFFYSLIYPYFFFSSLFVFSSAIACRTYISSKSKKTKERPIMSSTPEEQINSIGNNKMAKIADRAPAMKERADIFLFILRI